MREEVFRERVLPLFGLSVFIMALGSAVAKTIPFVFTPIGLLVLFLLEIALIVSISLLKRKSPVNLILLLLFSLVSGMTLSPIIYTALAIDPTSLAVGFIMTALFFFGLVFYSLSTKKDFRSLGGFLVGALLVAIVASIFNFFIKNLVFDFILDVVIVVIFLGMILLDMSRILRDYDDGDYVTATLSLYLDFINILVRIISILLRVRRRE